MCCSVTSRRQWCTGYRKLIRQSRTFSLWTRYGGTFKTYTGVMPPSKYTFLAWKKSSGNVLKGLHKDALAGLWSRWYCAHQIRHSRLFHVKCLCRSRTWFFDVLFYLSCLACIEDTPALRRLNIWRAVTMNWLYVTSLRLHDVMTHSQGHLDVEVIWWDTMYPIPPCLVPMILYLSGAISFLVFW